MVCVFLVSSVQHNQLLHRGGPSVVLLDEGITTGWKQHVLPTNTTGLDVLSESARAYLPIILTRKSTNTVSSLSEPGSRDYVWLIPQKNSNKEIQGHCFSCYFWGQNQSQRADNTPYVWVKRFFFSLTYATAWYYTINHSCFIKEPILIKTILTQPGLPTKSLPPAPSMCTLCRSRAAHLYVITQ